MPKIQLLDGKQIPFAKSISGFELTKKISKSLEKSALIMEVNGSLKDLSYEIKNNSKVKIITFRFHNPGDPKCFRNIQQSKSSRKMLSRCTNE